MIKLEYKWQVLTIICIGIFMSTLDGSILNIANPSIAADLSVSMQQVQWVVTAYMLVITATLLFFGKLGDEYGSSRIYTYGFLLFTTGSFCCSIAPTLALLIAARIFQGIGASMMMATGIGIVSNVFPSQERGRALGLTGTIVGLGNLSGPALGGLLLSKFSWPIIFVINIPIGLAGFILAYKYLPAGDNKTADFKFDFGGNLLFALAAAFLLLGLSHEQSLNLSFLIPGVGFLLLFGLLEKRYPYPLFDLELLHVKTFTWGNIMLFVSYATQTAAIFLLPFYMAAILNLSPTVSGLIMTIAPVTMALTAPLAGSLSDRIGPSRLTSAAFLLMGAAHLTFSSLSGGYHHDLPRLIFGLVLLGIGMGSFGSPNVSSILGAVSKNKAGYAGGFIATVRNFGYALGITSAVSLFTFILNSHIPFSPYPVAYLVANTWVFRLTAAICLAGLLGSIVTGRYQQPRQNFS